MLLNRSGCHILLGPRIVLGVAALLAVVVAQLPEGSGARAQPASDGFAVTVTVALPFTNVQSMADVATEAGESLRGGIASTVRYQFAPSSDVPRNITDDGGTVRSKVECTTTTGVATSTPPFLGRLVLGHYGNGAYAEAQDETELDVGDETGESLTIEAWFYDPGSLRQGDIINKLEAYELYASRYVGTDQRTWGCIGFRLAPPSGQLSGFMVCEWPPYSRGWHHVAGVFYKETGQMRIYLDGTAFSDLHDFGTAINNSASVLKVGSGLGGELDELRISDVARYTGPNYAVPTSPFTCDEHTRALWHFDEFKGATVFHDACGAVDNLLVGYNGAHTSGVPTVNTIGIYQPSTGLWFLRNANSSGVADLAFSYGAGISGAVPVVGDWDGDGEDTIGLYVPATGDWFLRNDNSGGVADLAFSYGAGISGAVPVVGDWNSDGTDTIGIYQPSTGLWFLRNENSDGVADLAFSYGAGMSGAVPLVGDWNNYGDDTIGLYLPSTGDWFLRNYNSSGVADLTFSYGAGISGGVPVVGDWNDDGTDTIGIYQPSGGLWFLRDANSGGVADLAFSYGAGISGGVAAVGDWDGL